MRHFFKTWVALLLLIQFTSALASPTPDRNPFQPPTSDANGLPTVQFTQAACTPYIYTADQQSQSPTLKSQQALHQSLEEIWNSINRVAKGAQELSAQIGGAKAKATFLMAISGFIQCGNAVLVQLPEGKTRSYTQWLEQNGKNLSMLIHGIGAKPL